MVSYRAASVAWTRWPVSSTQHHSPTPSHIQLEPLLTLPTTYILWFMFTISKPEYSYITCTATAALLDSQNGGLIFADIIFVLLFVYGCMHVLLHELNWCFGRIIEMSLKKALLYVTQNGNIDYHSWPNYCLSFTTVWPWSVNWSKTFGETK